jgi:hypothetical protein
MLICEIATSGDSSRWFRPSAQSRVFEKSELRQYLVQLNHQSSLPLRAVEKSFADRLDWVFDLTIWPLV